MVGLAFDVGVSQRGRQWTVDIGHGNGVGRNPGRQTRHTGIPNDVNGGDWETETSWSLFRQPCVCQGRHPESYLVGCVLPDKSHPELCIETIA